MSAPHMIFPREDRRLTNASPGHNNKEFIFIVVSKEHVPRTTCIVQAAGLRIDRLHTFPDGSRMYRVRASRSAPRSYEDPAITIATLRPPGVRYVGTELVA